MTVHRALAAAVAILAVAFGARGDPGAGISVIFAESAVDLPQDEIRDAITRELARRPGEGVGISGELDVAVQGQQLFVRFHGPRGYTGRVLTLPEQRSQIPVVLALVAGNLTRDQAVAVHVEVPVEPVEPVEPVADPAPAPITAQDRAEDAALLEPTVRKPRQVAYRRNYIGLHFAQDFTVVSGENVCDAGTATDHGFYCFYPDSDRPFDHAVDPTRDDVHPTFVVATTRLLASYDFALMPELTVGARIGFAFRGGPPAPKAPGASETTPFFPGHIEARVSYWLAPLTNPEFRAFVGLGIGAAQVDAKVRHTVRDCSLVADAADDPFDPMSSEKALLACQQGLPAENPFSNPVNGSVDVWKKAGQSFVGIHGGTYAAVSKSVSLAADMHLLFMLPAYAFVFEPSLGFVYTP